MSRSPSRAMSGRRALITTPVSPNPVISNAAFALLRSKRAARSHEVSGLEIWMVNRGG